MGINIQKKIKVALISNTGIGNEVFKALINNPSVILDSVLTRGFSGDFPYYSELELHELVRQHAVKCFVNLDVNVEYFEYLKERDIDLIIVATFSQIIKEHVINLPNRGIINFHPSLLPRYKGSTPMNWVILNGESVTGLTVHFLTNEVDSGPILLSQVIKLSENETIGSLFKKTSLIAGSITTRIICSFLNDDLQILRQDHEESTYFPNAKNKKFRIIDFKTNYLSATRLLRAFHPFPKAIIHIDQKEYLIENFDLNESEFKASNTNDVITIQIEGKNIVLELREN